MTIFLDIDGTIFKHVGSLQKIYLTPPDKVELLPGVKEKLYEWDKQGHRIILTTGRRECMRKITELQLEYHGIFYDQLIMGIGNGIRVLINDKKDFNDNETSVGISIIRNTGLEGVRI